MPYEIDEKLIEIVGSGKFTPIELIKELRVVRERAYKVCTLYNCGLKAAENENDADQIAFCRNLLTIACNDIEDVHRDMNSVEALIKEEYTLLFA